MTKSRTLTPAEWAEAVAMKESGEMTTEQIAHKFGVSKSGLYRRFKRASTEVSPTELAKAAEATVGAIKETALAEVAKQIEMIIETKETHYRIAKSLTGLSMKIIQDALREKVKLQNIHDDLKAVKVAMEINAIGKNIRYEILRIDDDMTNAGDIAVLPIHELTDEEAREFAKSKNGLDFDDDDLVGTEEDPNPEDEPEVAKEDV